MTEAYFVPHCDHPDCDLGAFQYICPKCEKVVWDYDVWWEQEELWKGKVVEFKCRHCKEPLTVKYNREDYKFEVE